MLAPILYVALAVPVLWLARKGYLSHWAVDIYDPVCEITPLGKAIDWTLDKMP